MSKTSRRPHRAERKRRILDFYLRPNYPRSRSIHDLTAQGRAIVTAIAMINVAREKAGSPIKLSKHAALKAASKAYTRHCGNTSRYIPHQGARECERRVRQQRA